MKKALILLGFLVFLSSASAEDILKTTSGEVLIGKIVSETDSIIVFQSNTFGEIKVPKDSVTVSQDSPSDTAKSAPVNQSAEAKPAVQQEELQKCFVQSLFDLSDSVSITLSGGFNHIQGKTDTEGYSTDLTLQYDSGKSIFQSNTSFAYADTSWEVSGQKYKRKIQDKASTNLRWNYTFNDRFQWLTHVGVGKDDVKMIDREIASFTMPMYTLFKNKKCSLLIGAGIGFRDKNVILQDKTLASTSGMAWCFYDVFSYQITPLLNFKQTFFGYTEFDQSSQYVYNANFDLSQALTKNLSLVVSYKIDFDNDELRPDLQENIDTLRLQFRYGF